MLFLHNEYPHTLHPLIRHPPVTDKQQSDLESGPALDREATPSQEGVSNSPAAADGGAAAAAKPKQSRTDRAKRLLLSLATKHHPQQQSPRQLPENVGGSSGVDGGTSFPAGAAATVSPLLTATDAATVRPGMVLAAVSACTGQGVSVEAVDTLGMGVKEAIKTLVK